MYSFLRIVKYSGILVIILSMTFSLALAGDEITVVSWGGVYTKSQIEAYHKPFTSKTGVRIKSEDYSGGIAEIRAQVEAGNVTWDVVDIERQDLMAACDEGLLVPIDWSTLPQAPDGTAATEDFVPGALHECGVGNVVYSTVLAYNKSAFPGKKPSTVADFFDLKNFPGVRALNKRAVSNLEYALLADGVPPKDVYKVLSTESGVNRAFAKLDTIKNSLIFWESGAQAPQMLADGEAVMTSSFNSRVFNAIASEKKPFAFIWDHHIFQIEYFSILKGTKNLKNAMEFVKFATNTKPLAEQAKYTAYGPARRSSEPFVTNHVTGLPLAPYLPTSPANFKGAVVLNAEWWADHQDEMNKRFFGWMAKTK